MNTAVKAVMKYPGAKWAIAKWVVGHLPEHIIYVEPFFGSGAVLFNKPVAVNETVNDVNMDVVNLFRVMREHPQELIDRIALTPWARDELAAADAYLKLPFTDDVERAACFLIKMRQAFSISGQKNTSLHWCNAGATRGAKNTNVWCAMPETLRHAADRLKHVEVEHMDAIKLIGRKNYDECLIYADPPYLAQTRSGKLYEHETDDEAFHTELIECLKRHKGTVVLSGYHSELYTKLVGHWRIEEKDTFGDTGQNKEGFKKPVKTEVLWIKDKGAEVVRPVTVPVTLDKNDFI